MTEATNTEPAHKLLTPNDSAIGCFLAKVAAEQAVHGEDDAVDVAAELVVRALAAAAATGRAHPAREIDGVVSVLADQSAMYADRAQAIRAGTGRLSRWTERYEDRAASYDEAAERLNEVIARAVEFNGRLSLWADWREGGVVEVFDDFESPIGEYIPLETPATAADTLEEVTRQLTDRGFVVVSEWHRSTFIPHGNVDDVSVHYTAFVYRCLS